MFSNRLAFAALGLACVTAAAGGGYLANRQAVPSSTTLAAASVAAEAPAAAKPVDETEAVVTPTPELPAPPAPAAPPRQVAPSRPAGRSSQTVKARASEPVLDHAWPSATANTPASSTASTPVTVGAVEDIPAGSTLPAASENRPAFQEPVSVPEPSQPRFEELVVSADSVIGLQLEGGVSSERARVEDPVEARVVRDVRVGREVAIPAGTRALGSVMLVERGGKFKDRARLGIRFHTLVLSDGLRLPITTDTIYRYGDAPGDGSAKRIGGGAVAGAILGAIIGGAKGAAVGATAGAGGGTAMVMSGDRSAAEFPGGTELTARILDPVAVAVDR